jgi:hypothetical protein
MSPAPPLLARLVVLFPLPPLHLWIFYFFKKKIGQLQENFERIQSFEIFFFIEK